MKKAIIFDLDGTLLNTIESMAVAGNRTLADFNLPQADNARYGYYAGDGADVLVERMLKEAGASADLPVEKVLLRYKDYFADTCSRLVSVYDGIREMLEALKQRHIRLTVLSNKPHENAITVIDDWFPDTFDIVQGNREGVPKKPDPTAANEILKTLGLQPQDCLYVGDTGVDMRTGKSAGIPTVGVLWGFREKSELCDNGACYLIRHPSELLPLAEQ